MPRRQLQRLALVIRHQYRAVFLGALVVLVLALLSASRLRFDTDILNLLPRDAPEVVALREALDEFGSIDLLVLGIRIPPDTGVGAYEELADQLGRSLTELDSLGRVDYKVGELDEIFTTFIPNALLFLDEEGRRKVEAKLTDDAVRQRVRELRRLVSTPQSLALKRLMLRDPMGLSEVFMGEFTSSKAGLELDWSSGYFLSRDHLMLLILAEPIEPPQNVDFAKAMMVDVESTIDSALSRWSEIAGEEKPPPEVVLGGRYVVALGDDSLIRRDVTINMVTSMIGVLLLFLFAFRRWGLLAYAFIPLASGLVLTFGFAAVTFGRLSAATSGVAALLIGLGIDFVIVSYGRYVEERQAGRDLEGALSVMSGSSGRAVLVGAITSAATFYAFGVTDFTGLYQMGLLTGTGILFCMVAVLLLLPAMLAWSEDHHRKRQREVRFYLHGLGSTQLIRFSMRRPWLILGVGLAITVFAGMFAFELEFEDSVQAMRPKGNPGVAVREEVAERFGLGFEQMMLLLQGESMEEVLELADRAVSEAEGLVRDGVLTGFDAVTSLIPPVAQQRANLAWLDSARQQGVTGASVRQVFAEEVAAEGMRLDPFEPGLDLFEKAIDRDRPLGIEDFQDSPQTARLLDRYLAYDGERWKGVVYLLPPPRIWRREAPPATLEMADRLGEKAQLTGGNVVSRFLRERVLRDAVLAAILGFALVAVLLWLDFRDISATAMSLAPLVLGIVWMLGGMAILGESMNFMSIFVTTMIIGIGVDYGIHILHRYRESTDRSLHDLENGLIQTGKAVVLAALSTTVGFGSLSLSHYPGLQSMGKVAILGALSTALVAITVLPAFLVLIRRRRA